MNVKWNDLHPNRIAKRFKKSLTNSAIENKNIRDSWQKYGSNVFVLNSELLEAFSRTDVGNIGFELIKFPFNFFFIAFEKPLYFFNGEVCEGFYLSTSIDENIKNIWVEYAFSSFVPTCCILDFKQNYTFSDILKESQLDELEITATVGNIAINALLYISSPRADIRKIYPSDVPIGFTDRINKATSKRKREVEKQNCKNAGWSIKTNKLRNAYRSHPLAARPLA